MDAAARPFEARWGLTPMSPGDRIARRAPAAGEKAKAERRGLVKTARESLRRMVRQAAALAAGDTDFLERLRDGGLRVRELRDDDGILVGYAVLLPGDRPDGGSRPVWFSAGSLAYDLSPAQVRERFDVPVGVEDWARAEARIRDAPGLFGRAGQAEGAGDVAALGDLLVVAAVQVPTSSGHGCRRMAGLRAHVGTRSAHRTRPRRGRGPDAAARTGGSGGGRVLVARGEAASGAGEGGGRRRAAVLLCCCAARGCDGGGRPRPGNRPYDSCAYEGLGPWPGTVRTR